MLAEQRPAASFIAATSSGRRYHSVSCRRSGSGRGRVVADPVGVAAPERREPGVEAGRGRAEPAHPDVGRQQPGQPAQRGRRGRRPGGGGHVDVRDLAAGVHARVGPARHGQRRGAGQPQQVAEGVLDHLLDGPPAGLARPAGELRAVVAEIEPEPAGRGLIAQRAQRCFSAGLSSAASASAGVLGVGLILGVRVVLVLSRVVVGRDVLGLVRVRGLGHVGCLGRLGVVLGRGHGVLGLGRRRRRPGAAAGCDRRARRRRDGLASASSWISSMTASGALSPLRGPILVIRV